MRITNKIIGNGPSGLTTIKAEDGTECPLANVSEVTISRSHQTTELPGPGLYPDDIMDTGAEAEVSFKVSSQYASLFGALVSGTLTTGGTKYVEETKTPTAGSFTVDQAASYVRTLAVSYAGKPLKRTTGTPVAGEYAVAAGVYTVHSSATGPVTVVYGHTDATMLVIKETEESVPKLISLVSIMNYEGQQQSVECPALRVTKVSHARKLKTHDEYDVTCKVQTDPTTGDAIITTQTR